MTRTQPESPESESPIPIVVDTNVFVAAGFNPQSASHTIVSLVRQGQLRMIWNEETRQEVKHIVTKIPRLSWEAIADLFLETHRYKDQTDLQPYSHVEDPADRKFAALAEAAGAVLITADRHLLVHRYQAATRIVTPGEFVRQWARPPRGCVGDAGAADI